MNLDNQAKLVLAQSSEIVPKFVADSSVSPTGLKWAVDPVADVVTTAGDLLYATAADTVTRLGIGTASQVLAVNSGATAPEWVTPAAGGGKVLQVVQGTLTGYTTTTSTSYIDLGLSVSITPSVATSTVLILVTLSGAGKDGGATGGVGYQLLRGATVIFNASDTNSANNSTNENRINVGITYLDSPATTSATTYKIQFKTSNASSANGVNHYGSGNTVQSTIQALEIGA